jgi:hypothetical protein
MARRRGCANLGYRNCVSAGRSAVTFCSNTAPEISSTARTQTELPFGGAAMKRVSTPPVTMPILAPMSISFGASVPSFATIYQRVWVPRWKPMPMQFTTAASVRVVASATVDPYARPSQGETGRSALELPSVRSLNSETQVYGLAASMGRLIGSRPPGDPECYCSKCSEKSGNRLYCQSFARSARLKPSSARFATPMN